jgi:hypothetical protein
MGQFVGAYGLRKRSATITAIITTPATMATQQRLIRRTTESTHETPSEFHFFQARLRHNNDYWTELLK